LKTEVLIIGGGATGTGIARDLALRGIESVLIEKKDINNGASGANHGLLHSGARYAGKDQQAAGECIRENLLLKELAPHCIENTSGFFVSVKGDEKKYASDFPDICRNAGIPVREIQKEEAFEEEPSLSGDITKIFEVPDATIDPFRLSLDNISDACRNGGTLLRFTTLIGFEKDGEKIRAALVKDDISGKEFEIEARIFVNAAGAWAGEVAAMAGAQIPMIFSKGTLLVTSSRISQRVINRLRPPGDSDIVVPGGTVSILGTTSVKADDLSDISPGVDEADIIINESMKMVPEIKGARMIRAYSGVRPLVYSGTAEGRSISRNYTLKDHSDEGSSNFITITGGKLTTFRLMAEKASDFVSEKLGVDKKSLTGITPLPESRSSEWTQPGKSSRYLLSGSFSGEALLCECEMVSTSMIDNIVENITIEKRFPSLKEIGLRSRIGKGSCQGAFCSFRIASYLYDKGIYSKEQGREEVKKFINERWKGLRPVIREKELVQADLQDSFLCGLLGLEN